MRRDNYKPRLLAAVEKRARAYTASCDMIIVVRIRPTIPKRNAYLAILPFTHFYTPARVQFIIETRYIQFIHFFSIKSHFLVKKKKKREAIIHKKTSSHRPLIGPKKSRSSRIYYTHTYTHTIPSFLTHIHTNVTHILHSCFDKTKKQRLDNIL